MQDIKIYHDYEDIFRRLKRKKWIWEFLTSGEVIWNMMSTTYQYYNIGHTADKRFWALQDYKWYRKIVTIAEVKNFDPSYVPEIAHKLFMEYDNGGVFVLNQMTELGDIPLPIRNRSK